MIGFNKIILKYTEFKFNSIQKFYNNHLRKIIFTKASTSTISAGLITNVNVGKEGYMNNSNEMSMSRCIP